MTKEEKKSLIIVAIIVVLLVLIAIWIAKKLSLSGGSTEENIIYGEDTGNIVTHATFPLVYNSRGYEVKQLQQYLNDLFGNSVEKLVVDGILGTKTKARLELVSYGLESNPIQLKLPIAKETFDSLGIGQTKI